MKINYLTLFPAEYKFDIFSASDLLGYSLPAHIHRLITNAERLDSYRKPQFKKKNKNKLIVFIKDEELGQFEKIHDYLIANQGYEYAIQFDIWLQRSKTTVDMLELRDFIKQCRCPFCDDKRIFKSLASHTCSAHGITSYEFKEMAGLARAKGICSPEYSEERRNDALKRDKVLVAKQMAAGRTKEVRDRADRSYRPATLEKRLKIANSPERKLLSSETAKKTYLSHKESFKKVMASVPHEVRSAAAKRVFESNPDEIINRVQRGHEKWAKKVGPEIVSQTIKNAHEKYKGRVGEDEVHRIAVKAGKVASESLKKLHSNPEWNEQWHKKTILAGRSKAKITREQYPEIVKRRLNGETTTKIAEDYGVSRRLIEKITNPSIPINIRRELYRNNLAKIDRKTIAAKIPLEVKQRAASLGHKALLNKIGKEGMRQLMLNARQYLTPESARIRANNAKITMRKYFDDPVWIDGFKNKLRISGKQRRKYTDEQIQHFIKLREEGMSYRMIGELYNTHAGNIFSVVNREVRYRNRPSRRKPSRNTPPENPKPGNTQTGDTAQKRH